MQLLPEKVRTEADRPVEMPVEPLVEPLLAHADAFPDCPSLRTSAGMISYGTLARMVRGAAAKIRRVLIHRGERVLLCGPNSPELVAAYFAVHAAGGVAVLLDADITSESARWIAEDSEARLALCERELDLPISVANLAAWCRADEGEQLASLQCSLEDPADLIYTTGTTGRKKGVLLSHANVAYAALNINAFLDTRCDDLECVPLPLSHSFGLGRLRCMAQAGHCLLLLPGMRNPALVLKLLLNARATGLALVPAGFDLILRMTKDHLGDAREHLRYIEIGSAAMPLETKRRLMELLPQTRICHHYGLTEASRAAFIEYHADRDHLASIGRPSPNVEMAVRDGEGHDFPDSQEGEIVVRGRMVMREYWKQPELTRQVLSGGWLRTGDRGYRDAEGYYYLTGRQSDLVNIGGRKVSPEEVEQALCGHPAVVESACVGIPDPQGIVGECLKACVVLRSEVRDEQLVEWLRQRVEEYKIPRVWQRVEKIAKTASGKIQRHLM
ncbi:MAG: class I adenylate-forming enzyme family protein [Planctomycetota bacterium]